MDTGLYSDHQEVEWNLLLPNPSSIGVKRKCGFDWDKNIKTVFIQKDGMERVYMITEAATPEFKALTGHDRMPRLKD